MPATAITPSSCWRRPYFHTIGGGLLPPAWSSHPHSHSAAKRAKDEVFSSPAPSIPLPPLQVPRGPQRLPLPPPHVKQHAPPLPALSPSAAPDLCPSHGSLCDTGAPSRLLSHCRAPHPRLPAAHRAGSARLLGPWPKISPPRPPGVVVCPLPAWRPPQMRVGVEQDDAKTALPPLMVVRCGQSRRRRRSKCRNAQSPRQLAAEGVQARCPPS